MNNEYPIHTLGEFIIPRRKTVNPNDFADELFELYSIPSHSTGSPEYVQGSDIGSTKYVVTEGEVLLSKINPKFNRIWIIPKQKNNRMIGSSEWIQFPKSKLLLPEYLQYFLSQQSFVDFCVMNSSGVGGSLTRIKPSILEDYPIRVPPLDIQGRIVATLDNQMKLLETAKGKIDAVCSLHERLDFSLLKAACKGKLVTNYAEKSRLEGEPFESGNQLISRVLEEKRRLWEKENPSKKYKQARNAETPSLPELPEGWCWAAFEQLFYVIPNKRFQVKKSEYLEKGSYPVIDQGEQFIGGYTENLDLLYTGPLPVIAFGDHTRRLKFVEDKFVCGGDGLKLIGVNPGLDKKYCFLMLRNTHLPDKGYSRHFQYLKNSLFPIPPLVEQNHISEFTEEFYNRMSEVNYITEGVKSYLPLLKMKLLESVFHQPSNLMEAIS